MSQESHPSMDLFRPSAWPRIRRLTVEEIVAQINRQNGSNGYRIFIGRSLTQPDHPALSMSLLGQHIKIIGRSQMGKSSLAAVLLSIITKTHDPAHVQLALLDLEHVTSKLFAELPHVAEWRCTRLHARTPEEVVAHLGLVVEMMEYRATLPARERAALPVLLVYLEEFAALVDSYGLRLATTRGEEREQARSAYEQLIAAVLDLARRGLKARVQLLLCTQVGDRDENLRKGLVNIASGISFCVRPSAAAAAGFCNTELLRRNAQDSLIGQAVVETPEINDLLLTPDFDLEKRLLECDC